jgi:enoyl-CoA hydratase
MSTPAHKWLRTTECLTFETEGAVAWITLNRPEKRNALSRTLLRELREALLEADDRKAVRSIVLAGAGKDFCAGYDMAASSPGGAPLEDGYDPALYRRSADGIDDDAWRLERNQADILTLFDLHKPVIAAVHGHCVAGGTDLALACDMVIAAADARIGFPAVRSQGTPPMHWWIYHVGPQWAKRLLLTGDLLSGRDAARIRLVLKAVPAARLREEAGALAQRLALIDADVLAANKRIVNMAMELMGARTMQRFAAETDARGHLAAAARAFTQTARSEGLSRAFRLRDAPFGDGMVRLDEEE